MAVGLKLLIFFLILGCPCFEALNKKQVQEMKNIQQELLQNLRKYAIKLEDKINLIEESIAEYTEEIKEANQDPELYISNPLNSFRLIRQMHQDWVSWQVYMEKPVAPEAVENLERLLSQLPPKKVYKRVAKDVHDLAQFYDYKPSDLVAKNERKSYLHLSPLDCYSLGLERYEEKDYLGAVKWLSVAADNYTMSEYSDLYAQLGAPHWQVYRDQARVLLKLNRPSFIEAYVQASNHSPFNVHLMDEVGLWELTSLRDPMDPIPDPLPNSTLLENQCRGHVVPKPNLFCDINNSGSDFLKLAPLGYEMLVKPFTVLYPNSVYESELQHVEKAYEQCPLSNQLQLAKGVIGCSISHGYSPTMRRIKNRVLDMTGLSKTWHRSFVLEYDSLKPLDIAQVFRNATEPNVNSSRN
ncbi:prolyl 4-hydroxylase subunit alpha-1 isoform X2 [Drosophila serrata]|uniref:prolyl 4-hydroxylase subunit alpha-1 isoform X2 n=1 Tax=Drosophila serrata TaxID=7274 RepID=UPI000A1D2E0C|nr:prolyl 4-hydroxylase subunit alpha-1 isoform X2 [Drosophila serrata]